MSAAQALPTTHSKSPVPDHLPCLPALQAGGADSEAVRSELLALDRVVRGIVLGLTLARGLALAHDAAARLRRAQERALTGQKAKVRSCMRHDGGEGWGGSQFSFEATTTKVRCPQ